MVARAEHAMRPDFPRAAHAAVEARMGRHSDVHPQAWAQWAAAWNAVAYRFWATAEDDETFRGLIAANSADRYAEERALFGFFVNACSTVESTAYSLFALGAMVIPARFPLSTPDEQRRVSLLKTAARYGKAFSEEPVTNALADVVRDSDWHEIANIRNVLAHRAAPPRDHWRGGPSDGRTDWRLAPHGLPSLNLADEPTARFRVVLSSHLGALLAGAEVFVEAHF
jgi:hypothetical protein